jgi:plastocyanin
MMGSQERRPEKLNQIKEQKMKSRKLFKPTLATTLGIDSWRLVLLLATAVSLIGYPKPASAATVNVAIGYLGGLAGDFYRSSVTIYPGDQVKWVWLTSGHSTTSGRPGMPNGIWNSGVRSQGATFTHTFNSVGTFPYYCISDGQAGQVIVTKPTPTPTDFNNDGRPDYLLYNGSAGETVQWYLKNNVLIGAAHGPTLPTLWRVAGVADFNRDGHPDYLLFNSATRQTALWYLNENVHIGTASGPSVSSRWELVATGDFNKDGKPDWVVYDPTTQQTVIWYFSNSVRIGAALGPILPVGYSIVGAADFNRDGNVDYLLFNPSTRQTAIWYLSGVTHVTSSSGPTIPSGYELIGTADFNGDGRPDYLLSNPVTRQTVIWYLNNNVFVSGASGPTPPPGWSVAAP